MAKEQIESCKKVGKNAEGRDCFELIEAPVVHEKVFSDITESDMDKNIAQFAARKAICDNECILAKVEGREQDVERHTLVGEAMQYELDKWNEAKTKIGKL